MNIIVSKRAGLDALRARVRSLEGGGEAASARRLALGLESVDDVLGGGLAFGRVHEVTGNAADGFAVALLARAAGGVLWCRRPGAWAPLYPPGLMGLGLDPDRVLQAVCRGADEPLWAMEEALSSGAVAMAVAEVDRRIDLTASRRLQLAAERGGALGLVLPPSGRDGALAPNALSTRWQAVCVPGGRWRLDLMRQRGGGQRGGGTGSWIVEWATDETGSAHRFALVSPAGDGPAPARAAC